MTSVDAIERRDRVRHWLLLAALAALPALDAVLQLGRLHPDEVFQYLEPAYFRDHGYGIRAWEWQVGLRNWAIPGLFSALLRLCDALGIDHPRVYRAVLEVPQYLLHLASLGAVFAYARRRLSPSLTWVAVLLVGLYGPLIAFSGRTLGESFSGSLLLLAVAALDDPERPVRAGVLGGAALGLSVVARYGSVVFVVTALGWLVYRRRWVALLACCGAGLVVAAGLGALDLATWGDLFHSLKTYLHYNVFSSEAADRFGREPATDYLPYLGMLTPLWAWPGLWQTVRKGRPPAALGLTLALVYFLAVSVTAHKEARFLYPALLLWVLDGSVGFVDWVGTRWSLSKRAWEAVAAGGIALAAVSYPVLGPQRGDQFRAIAEATRQSDATGFLLIDEGLWGSGGYFYIGKRIPFLWCDRPTDPPFVSAMRDPRFNRVVTYDGIGLEELERAGFRVRERIGEATWLAR